MLQSFIHVSYQTNLWNGFQNVHRIIQAGSTKSHLQNLAVEIYNECLLNSITLFAEWIQREKKTIAEYYSKYPTDDWSIDDETFGYIKWKFENFTIDRCSNELNQKVFALIFHWADEFNWLFSLTSVIEKSLINIWQHAKQTMYCLFQCGNQAIFGLF